MGRRTLSSRTSYATLPRKPTDDTTTEPIPPNQTKQPRQKIKIKLADGTAREISHQIQTTFWSRDENRCPRQSLLSAFSVTFLPFSVMRQSYAAFSYLTIAARRAAEKGLCAEEQLKEIQVV